MNLPQARPLVLARNDHFLHGRLGALRRVIRGGGASLSVRGSGNTPTTHQHRGQRPTNHTRSPQSFDGAEFGTTAPVLSYTRVNSTFDSSKGPMVALTMSCLPSGERL